MDKPIHTFMPLRSVELDILISVARTPRHGYGILQDAEGRSAYGAGFEIPTLYRALKRLGEKGLIQVAENTELDAEDPRREYWVATPLGKRVLQAELSRLEVLLAEGRALAEGHA